MKRMERFWMVWSPQGQAPTRQHPSRASADAEAARLARANPAHAFFVLKAVGGAMAEAPQAKLFRLTGRVATSMSEVSQRDGGPF